MKIYSKDYFALPTINKHLFIITYWLVGKMVTAVKAENKDVIFEYNDYYMVERYEKPSTKAALSQHNKALDDIENIKAKVLAYYSTNK